MKQAIITPHSLYGEITAPPSKSYAHRALITAALAKGHSTICGLALSEDILATIDGLRAFGARVVLNGDTAQIDGCDQLPSEALVNCRESGSTLRFLIPIAAALGISATFTGAGRLPSRPLTVYRECLPSHGVNMEPKNGLPVRVSGSLTSGTFLLDGSISSQFITGLLFALPLLEGDSELILTSSLESKGYVDMTIELLRLAGIEIHPTAGGYRIRGGQTYQPFDYTVEGDYSQAAFFLVAGALGAQPVVCKGLKPDSVQGDRKILDLLRYVGAKVEVDGSTVTVSRVKLSCFTRDCSDIPDLVPILAVLASYCKGTTYLTHIERLQLKESNRIKTTAELLSRFGVECQFYHDRLVITGSNRLCGCTVNSHNDHRIAMAAAIAATSASSDVVIEHADCVNKSYPNFFEDFNQLGGNAHVIPME